MKWIISFCLMFLLLIPVMGVSAKADCLVSVDAGQVSVDTLVGNLTNCSGNTPGIKVESATNGVGSFREGVLNFSSGFLQYAALFAVGAIVVAGVMYTTAYGDGEKLKKAKDTAIYACIGLFVALISYSLVNAVLYIIYGAV